MMGNNMSKTQFFHRTEINNHDNTEITGKKKIIKIKQATFQRRHLQNGNEIRELWYYYYYYYLPLVVVVVKVVQKYEVYMHIFEK